MFWSLLVNLRIFLSLRKKAEPARPGALLDFEKQSTESDDVIEDLKEDDRMHRIRHSAKSHDQSYKAQIRRKYRRMIRKHRKDIPYPSESPTEIELAAGLKDDIQMQELHVIYEQVRYGNTI